MPTPVHSSPFTGPITWPQPSMRPHVVSLLLAQTESLREALAANVNESPSTESYLELERVMHTRNGQELNAAFRDGQIARLAGVKEAFASWIVYSALNDAAISAQRQGIEVTSRLKHPDGMPERLKSNYLRRQEAMIAEEMATAVEAGGQPVIAQATRGAALHLLKRLESLFEA